KKPIRRPRPARVRTPQARPTVEALEDRLTPSILFTPQHGAVNATNPGGTVLGTTRDVDIYLVFWGSYWASSQGQAYANQIASSLAPMLLPSPSLDSLRQYGVMHHARAGLNEPDFGFSPVAFDYADPPDGFSTQASILAAFYGIQHGMPVD